MRRLPCWLVLPRFGGLCVLAMILGVLFCLSFSTSAMARQIRPRSEQAPETPPSDASTDDRPALGQADADELDTRPLARYVPSEGLVFYAEHMGTALHQDAWQRTASYDMLNETSLGEVLKEMVSRGFRQATIDADPAPPLSGEELADLLEHILKNGVMVAAIQGGNEGQAGGLVIAIRGAAGKEIRGAFARFLATMYPPESKPALTPKGNGRQVVLIEDPAGGNDWAWWVEGTDVLIVPTDPDHAEIVFEVLDGQKPSAEDLPILAELTQFEVGFQPLGFAFLDGTLSRNADLPSEAAEAFQALGIDGVERMDLRWGTDDRAILTVGRMIAPSPRQGLLGLLDMPTFDKDSMPPMPSDIRNFLALSIEPQAVFDQMIEAANTVEPGSGDEMRTQAEEAARGQTGMKLSDDILQAIGPKMVFYVTPRPEPVDDADPARPGPGGARPGANNPLAGAMGALNSLQLPQLTMVLELQKSPAEFTRVLDALYINVNRQLEDLFTLPDLDPQPDQAGRPGQGSRPAPAKAAGREAPRLEAPKFRVASITPRTYVLDLPQGLSALTGLNPTVMLGQKHVIFSTSASEARQARIRESQGEGGALAGALAEALAQTPANLTLLAAMDPADWVNSILASLPGLMQVGSPLNLLGNQGGPAVAGGQQGGPVMGAGPGRPGAPGSPRGRPPLEPFDVSKLPTTDELRPHLFPGTLAVSVEDQEVRLEIREAFPILLPAVGGTVAAQLLADLLNSRQADQEAADLEANPGNEAPEEPIEADQ